MKLKNTLLIAAAALGATVISSQAQVYSQNVVGYANVKLVTGYNMVANQFNCGISNGANEVFPNIPDSTAIFQWNGFGYTVTYKDFSAPPDQYYMSDYATPTNAPIILPGQACFLQLPFDVTNTFTGSIAALAGGGTATNDLITGYNMVGSKIPYAGSVTNTSFNFNPPDSTAIFSWNGSGYTIVYKDYSAPPDQYYMSDYATPTNPPALNVGQGVFMQLPGSYKWVETLQ